MSDLDLQSTDLSHANLKGANLQSVNLQSSLLMYADLRDADLRDADLRGANLSAANLSRANLQGARLNYACLDHCNLYRCDLSHADLRKSQLSHAYFNESILENTLMTHYPNLVSGTPVKYRRMVSQGAAYRIFEWNTHLKEEKAPISIFLHGMTGHALDFEMIAQTLEHVVYAIDLPGHGESSAIPLVLQDELLSFDEVCNYLPQWSDIIEQLSQICDRLTQGQPFHLIGYSMGARLALAMACTLNTTSTLLQVQHLHLISASYGLATPEERSQRCMHDEQWIHQLIQGDSAEFIANWSKQAVLSLVEIPTRLAQDFNKRRLMNDPYQLAYAFKILGLGEMPYYEKALAHLKIPCSCYVGSKDHKFIAKAKQICAQITHAQLCEIPEAGHAIQYEDMHTFLDYYLEQIELGSVR
jgi:2-succinyl-6-hydroxy-2,4-cyclohexadiene-1-carboxylate synthase